MDVSSQSGRHTTRRSTYALVFLALVFLTAIEVGLTFVGLPRQTLTGVFLALSLGKASLVASFYMHLRSDSPIYTYIFALPAALLAVFVLMTSLY
jgi:caa(3)-type oxidase subunit IV